MQWNFWMLLPTMIPFNSFYTISLWSYNEVKPVEQGATVMACELCRANKNSSWCKETWPAESKYDHWWVHKTTCKIYWSYSTKLKLGSKNLVVHYQYAKSYTFVNHFDVSWFGVQDMHAASPPIIFLIKFWTDMFLITWYQKLWHRHRYVL